MKKELTEIIEDLMISHDEEDELVEPKNIETIDEYLKYLDSIRFIELITAIECKYNIEIKSSDLVIDNFKELDMFINVIKKYLK